MDFVHAFTQFARELHQRLGEDDKHIWTRFSDEWFDHRRTGEVGCWFGSGTGDERGHVFIARSQGWDGKVNWDRVMEIVADDNLALTQHEPIRTWNLAFLDEQTAPDRCCDRCGKPIS